MKFGPRPELGQRPRVELSTPKHEMTLETPRLRNRLGVFFMSAAYRRVVGFRLFMKYQIATAAMISSRMTHQ